MDGNNQEQEAQNQEIDVNPPTAKRLRHDDEPKREHGPKKRIRNHKTTQTRRPITKTTPTGKCKSFLSFKLGNIPRYT